jgi:UDP-N-acetylmuramoylalanine--D-glutamate ligase
VAVLLNITPDHLDRYESFDAYAASKVRLLDMSTGVIVRGRDVGLDQSHWPALQGPHNAQNAAAAIETCRALGIGEREIDEGLCTYPGLPHRMERVREKDGVLFVNDSKATNPTATAPALAAFDSIRWIVGGQAKSDNLDECAPHFGHVRCAYTIGESAKLFEGLLSPHMPVKNCGKLGEAVRQAAQDSRPGDTVLLSPACASFDQFRDFEDRGDQFKALVGAV